jgi:hypothetical protein
MTLLRLVQRVSILAGITSISLSIPYSPAKAEISEVCIIASNGKTVCGKMRLIERMCVTTDGRNNICGKFKSAKEEQERGQEQSEVRTPAPSSGYRKEVDNFEITLESCKRVNTDINCQLAIKNKSRERPLSFYGRSSTLVEFTSQSYRGTNSLHRSTIASGDIWYTSVTFENIPDKVVKAQLLSLSFAEFKQPVQFRNVAFSN